MQEVQDLKQKRNHQQAMFSTPKASPVHQKPQIDSNKIQSVPRFYEDPEENSFVKGGVSIEDEIEAMKDLKINGKN